MKKERKKLRKESMTTGVGCMDGVIRFVKSSLSLISSIEISSIRQTEAGGTSSGIIRRNGSINLKVSRALVVIMMFYVHNEE